GVTLYELLTLQKPFADGDRQELLRRINLEEPPWPRRRNSAIPAELETILLTATAREPADRYTSAQAFADDLRRFLDNRPIQARRPTLLQRVSKCAGRHQRAVALGLVGLLFVVVMLSVSILLIARERNATLERERELRKLLYVQNIHLAYEAWQ